MTTAKRHARTSEATNPEEERQKTALHMPPVQACASRARRVQLIESWWRHLKHSWLYINTLDSRAAVQRLVTFYVREFNEAMPHGALDWRTPDEVYFGRAEDVPS